MASLDLLNINSERYMSEFYNNSDQPYNEITLEYVSGVSCQSKSAISADPNNGNVARVTSSVIVLSDPQHHDQAFIENPSAREIACVAFSEDGRFLAFGEFGVNPAVAVFNAKVFTQVNIFKVQEGKCTIKAIQFHPRAIYMALLFANNYGILLYEFIHGTKLAMAKWCVEPLAMTMTKMDSKLLVCGHRKISCFSLSNVESNKYETNAMLEKKAVLLGKQGNFTFVDIASGDNQFVKCIYTVTCCGHLCDIKAGVVRSVLKVCDKCNCIKFALGLLLIGCENGIVNLCSPDTLSVIARIDDNDLFGRDQRHPVNWAIKSDILALAINAKTRTVTTLMSNHQTHSWFIKSIDGGFECSPVVTLETAVEKKYLNAKLITRHDLNCTLAQLLLQMEMSNRNQKISKTNYLQRHSAPRFRQLNAIKITPDGTEIIVGNKLGQIKVYEATTGDLKKIIDAHNAEVTFIEVMYDNDFKLVATGGRDRVIFILNVKKEYKLVQAINDHASAIVSISLAHNNGILTLVSSSKDGVILIRRARKEDTPKFITIGELPECLGSKARTYNHSRGYIITGQEKGRINVFPFDQQINMLKPVTKIQVGNVLLKSVAIDPTSSFIVAFGAEGQYVFHLQTGQQIATLCYLPGFHHLSFSQDLNYLINSNDSGCKFLWRLPTKIKDVMHNNLKGTTSMMVTSREFVFNSYMSCVRVCQHVVKEEEESSSTLKGSIADKENKNGTEIEDLLEEKNIHKEGKSMLDKARSQEIMNFLCDDRQRGLAESVSCSSCCTTCSQSLADVEPVIDHSGGDGDVIEEESKIIKADARNKNYFSTLNLSQAEADIEKTQNLELHHLKPKTSLTTHKLSLQSSARNALGLVENTESKNMADGETKSETLEMVSNRDKKRSLTYQCKDSKSNHHRHSYSKSYSDYETGSNLAITCARRSQLEEKTNSSLHESETLNTTLEALVNIPERALSTDLYVDVKSQDRDTEKMSITSQVKDSGLVEDLIPDCPFINMQMEDSNTKRSFTPSTKSSDSPSLTIARQGKEPNNITATPYEIPSGTATTVHLDDDFDIEDNNLNILHEVQVNDQLQDYYTKFCRNIHLSNSQETYVLKEGEDYEILNISFCLDDVSGKNSTSNTFAKTKSQSLYTDDEIPLSFETRLLFPNASVTGQNSNSESEQGIYLHDAKQRQVFLSWVRKKLNKERRRKKQVKVLGRKQEDCPLPEIFQDVFSSETFVDDISSTTDTDYITTGSNVTFASNSSLCKEVMAPNVQNSDRATLNTPCQTASEPVAGAMLNTLSRSQVGVVQWQRSVSYASTSRLQTKSRRGYSPTYAISNGSEQSPQMSLLYTNGVSGGSNVLFGRDVEGGGGGGGFGKLQCIRSENLLPSSTNLKSSGQMCYSLSDSQGSPMRECVNTFEPFIDLVPQKSHESFESTPSIESNVGMVSLFRNQDDYLRKLKEVRRTFEKSIQALSNERKNQQIEAQKYFMNQ